jgi:hypothetical protein
MHRLLNLRTSTCRAMDWSRTETYSIRYILSTIRYARSCTHVHQEPMETVMVASQTDTAHVMQTPILASMWDTAHYRLDVSEKCALV